MRRTLLSVLVAVVTFAATSAVLVAGFALVSGHSSRPTQGSSASAPEPSTGAEPSTQPSSSPDATTPATTSGLTTGPLGGVGIGFGPASGAPEPTAAPVLSTPKTGVLSQDFRKLGIDDPTTVIDESLRDACDVVGAPITGPALCNDR